MTPEKIKEYTELLEKYIKESVALPFIGSSIILSTPIATELLELLKSIRYANIYENPITHVPKLVMSAIAEKYDAPECTADIIGGNWHEHIGSAIEESQHTMLNHFETIGVIKLT